MPAEIGDGPHIAVEPIAGLAQRLEAHVAGIHHQELAGRASAEADDLADRFRREAFP